MIVNFVKNVRQDTIKLMILNNVKYFHQIVTVKHILIENVMNVPKEVS